MRNDLEKELLGVQSNFSINLTLGYVTMKSKYYIIKGKFMKRNSKTLHIINNTLLTIGILSAATIFCFVLEGFTLPESRTHVPLIYVLAVLLISRFTDGYLYGVFAAVAAVICVNYIFTYPYFAVDFTIAGYPITFLVMLTVAVIVSALMTQIKKQEQIRREIEKEKMRANLLRAVSHDIRTPLTSIAGSAAGIIENKDHLSRTQEMELLGNIQEDAQWLVRIVENLLSITRMNSEDARLETIEEVAEDVISGAIVKFHKRFPEVSVQANSLEDVILVPMDAILIEQVILNLMENAVIHGKTTTELRVNLFVEDKQAVFTVEDNGEGIKESILPVIFEGSIGSHRENESDKKRNMGIGLSVCSSIIKAHKGTMKAENKEEGGAKMTFTLPFV